MKTGLKISPAYLNDSRQSDKMGVKSVAVLVLDVFTANNCAAIQNFLTKASSGTGSGPKSVAGKAKPAGHCLLARLEAPGKYNLSEKASGLETNWLYM